MENIDESILFLVSLKYQLKLNPNEYIYVGSKENFSKIEIYDKKDYVVTIHKTMRE